MSKNMTRKGLAFGAGLALIGSGIVALPAQAAGTITLNPSSGSLFNTLSSSTFKLMPILAGVESAEYKYLRYRVQNVDTKAISVAIEQGSTGDGEFSYQYGSTSNVAVGPQSSTASFSINDTVAGAVDTANDEMVLVLASGEGAKFATGDRISVSGITSSVAGQDAKINGVFELTDVTSDTLKYVVTLSADLSANQASENDTTGRVVNLSRVSDDDFVVHPDDLDSSPGNNAAVIGGQNYLKLAPITDEAVTATVTAWIDTNQNNTIDAGETVSTAQTVSFKDVSKLSGTVSFSKPLIGDTSLKATVTLTGDINYRQIDSGDVQILFQGPTSSYADIGSAANVAWDSTAGAYMVTFTNADLSGSSDASIDAGDLFKATLLVDNNRDGDKSDEGDKKATATTSAVAALANPTFEMKVVSASNAITSTDAETDGGTDAADYATSQDGAAAVRTGAASFTVSVFVGSDAATPIGQGDRPVKITVAGTNVTNSDAVVAGGKSVTDGAASFTVTTDSTGKATFTVSLGAADAGDVLRFTPNIDGSDLNYLDVTVTDGDFTLNQMLTGSPSIKEGSAFSIEYGVADQFGVAPANNTMSVLVSPTTNERSTAADWSYSIPVVAGKATLSVTDNGKGAGKFTANAKLVLNGTTSAVTNGTVNTVVNVVADPTPAKITLEKVTYGTAQANDANNDGDYADSGDTDNTALLLLETKSFGNYDSRFASPTALAPEARDTYKVVVGGKVTNAAGTAIVGAPVTFTAKGFLFKSGTRYALDTITVHANSSGIASVDAWSQVGGAQKVVITSGAATADQALTFAAGSATAADFTITAATTSEPGKTVDVKVSVKDKFGNAAQGVAVTLRSTGPGYLLQTSITTDKLGEAFTKLLVGASEAGSAVVVATMTIAGVETSKSATIAIGAAEATAVVGSFNGRVAVRVENAKGSTVSVKIGKSWYKYSAISNNYLQSWKSRKGASVAVSVYVDGELQNVQTITVK